MKKIILVDGNNLLFRSFFATAYQGVIMKNSKGFPTNALYGFINMMNRIIKEENPNYIMVAFDKGKTFRHDKYNDYKAGRAAMPDELKLQFPKAKEVLDSMGIKYFEIDNYEADDIIGTLARKVDEEKDFIGTIVSSDKDLLQLISDEVTVKLLKSNDYIMMTKEEFKKTYGLEPKRMVDLKALMGDSSDNIPGVKGIGEKTAIKLLCDYGSLDELYQHIDEIKGKTKEKLEQDKDNAYMSYDLATIYREVPLDFDLDDCIYKGYNTSKFKEELEELEFYSLLKKIDFSETNEKKEEIKKEEFKLSDINSFEQKDFAFYLETRGSVYSKSEILGIGIYDGINNYFISSEDLSKYNYLFDSDVNKFTYDLKRCLVVLNNLVDIKNVSYDAMVALYLLDYVVKDDISFVARSFDYDIVDYETMFGTDKRPKDIDNQLLIEQCCLKAKFIYETREEIINKLNDDEEYDLFNNIEMPLINVLADMELTGIRVDKDYLKEVEVDLSKQIKLLEQEIYDLAGKEFNIMSPLQLGVVLFDDLGIHYPKKVKDDKKYSTSKDILDKIVDLHPIVNKILEYRTLNKLYTNYAVGLQSEVRDDNRIHTIFTQTLTRTGRLSSIEPNLQNIPARSEYSRLIRKAFIPDDDSVLLSSDYSQVELRIFAHVSNEKNLIQAFVDGKDIHAKTASDIFHVPMEDVTKDMRRSAKAVNFGILYGISGFGLSEDLGIDIKDAKKFMDDYLNTYPGILNYMEEEKAKAYKYGYVKTLMNRKRVIEELNNKNYLIRSSGERMALNTPIQGTAADILKKAMVEIYDEFNKLGLKSKMLIQVHDELVFNVLNNELDIVKKIVRDKMENTIKLSVPLKVEIEMGNNWYEAK